MNRDEKAAAVAELSEDLKGAETIFAVDYRGISVTEAAELRRRLREADAVFKVVKNRLAKLAVADAGTEGFDELLAGPTALALVKGDAVIAAKAISTFAREHEVVEYKGGLMDGAPLDADGFAAIARLPGLDALHGQLVGLTASPLTGLVTGLGSMISGLAIALGQIAEQGLVSGEAPAAEEAGEPEADAEAPTDEGDEEPAAESGAADEPAAEAGEPAEPAAEPEEPAAEAGDEAPPAEHAEQEAQPTEPDQAPAEEPPGDDDSGDETSEQSEPEQEEPSGDESDD